MYSNFNFNSTSGAIFKKFSFVTTWRRRFFGGDLFYPVFIRSGWPRKGGAAWLGQEGSAIHSKGVATVNEKGLLHVYFNCNANPSEAIKPSDLCIYLLSL
jgi:hypothetical protein